ncbi:hypothetical protein ACH6CV_02920 [Bacillota bacterium Meth-B3]|nr:hypothetical protein [Christensenellaceae bacterium]MEA5064768.1 hypothetical protein [Eubacteriales bacterium]
MIHQLYFALNDVRRRMKLSALFMLSLYVATVFSVFCLEYLPQAIRSYRAAWELQRANITVFSPYYAAYGIRYSSAGYGWLTDLLDNDKGVYSIIDQLAYDAADPVPIVIALGSFGQAFGIDAPTCDGQRMPAYVGHNVTGIHVGDTIGIEKLDMDILERLPRGASYFRGLGLETLDDKVLVFSKYAEIGKLPYPDLMEQAMANLGVVDATPQLIESIVAAADDTGMMNLIPRKLSESARLMLGEQISAAILTCAYIVCALVFVLMGISVTLLTLVDQNLSAYAVQRLCGARLEHLYAQMLFHTALIVVPPIVLAGMYANGGKSMPIALFIMGIAILVSFLPMLSIKRHDMVFFLRRDQ